MAEMTLIRHWGVRETAGQEPVSGHPPIPGQDALRELRRWITDDATRHRPALMWWHRGGDAWAAVTGLHQAGRHDDALALAMLLRWCDAWPHDQMIGQPGVDDPGVAVWELRPTDHDTTEPR